MEIKTNNLIRDSRPKLASIEAARGIAALLVVLFHATAIINLPKYFSALPFSGFFLFGYAGVDFFSF
jgi:exopolysaccharide production protein ExoZ